MPVNWPAAHGNTPTHALNVVTVTGIVLASFRMAEVGGYSIEPLRPLTRTRLPLVACPGRSLSAPSWRARGFPQARFRA